MIDRRVAAAMSEAMARLHWSLRDLFVAASSYGSVGAELDVGIHLRTGTQLTGAQAGVLMATLNDALFSVQDPFRVVAQDESVAGGHRAARSVDTGFAG